MTVIKNNRYMADLLLFSDLLADLQTVSRESIILFKSTEFKLLERVANSISKPVLSEVPKNDLDSNLREIGIWTQLMPASKALGRLFGTWKTIVLVCHANKK